MQGAHRPVSPPRIRHDHVTITRENCDYSRRLRFLAKTAISKFFDYFLSQRFQTLRSLLSTMRPPVMHEPCRFRCGSRIRLQVVRYTIGRFAKRIILCSCGHAHVYITPHLQC